MKTKEPLTKVLFRVARDKSREVCALFPSLAGTYDPCTCQAYAHVGQHSSASVDYMRDTRPAKPAEYRDLAQELRGLGYRLQIAHRFTPADLQARKEQLK